MARIALSALAAVLMMGGGVIAPASGNDTLSGPPPTSCDCSNCSAEWCKPDPPGPKVTYVGGVRTSPSKTTAIKSGD